MDSSSSRKNGSSPEPVLDTANKNQSPLQEDASLQPDLEDPKSFSLDTWDFHPSPYESLTESDDMSAKDLQASFEKSRLAASKAQQPASQAESKKKKGLLKRIWHKTGKDSAEKDGVQDMEAEDQNPDAAGSSSPADADLHPSLEQDGLEYPKQYDPSSFPAGSALEALAMESQLNAEGVTATEYWAKRNPEAARADHIELKTKQTQTPSGMGVLERTEEELRHRKHVRKEQPEPASPEPLPYEKRPPEHLVQVPENSTESAGKTSENISSYPSTEQLETARNELHNKVASEQAYLNEEKKQLQSENPVLETEHARLAEDSRPEAGGSDKTEAEKQTADESPASEAESAKTPDENPALEAESAYTAADFLPEVEASVGTDPEMQTQGVPAAKNAVSGSYAVLAVLPDTPEQPEQKTVPAQTVQPDPDSAAQRAAPVLDLEAISNRSEKKAEKPVESQPEPARQKEDSRADHSRSRKWVWAAVLLLAAGTLGYGGYTWWKSSGASPIRTDITAQYGMPIALNKEDVFETDNLDGITDFTVDASSAAGAAQGYPAFGDYTVKVSWKENGRTFTREIPVTVADTMKPVIQVTEQIEIPVDATSFDYDAWIQVTDNDATTLQVDDSAVEYGVPGTYAITVTATDDSQNASSQIVTVEVSPLDTAALQAQQQQEEEQQQKELADTQNHPDSENTDVDTSVVPAAVRGIAIINKKYGLPQSYAPGENAQAAAALKQMITDMQAAGLDISDSYSGYRSYDYQQQLYDSYVKANGQEAADTFSARPGYSEHQSGLAFDLKHSDGSLVTKQEEADWIAQHAHEYGFIVRYKEGWQDITGFMAEPWHIRYVGDEATDIYESGLCLEEYLGAEGGDYAA